MKDTVNAYFGAQDTVVRPAYTTSDCEVRTVYSLVLPHKMKREFKEICVKHNLSPAAIARDLLSGFIEDYRDKK